MLIDTHAHVQFSGFKDDADQVMQRALDAGMIIINVGSQIDTSREAVAMLDKYPERVYAVVGLHPVHTYQQMLDEEESHFLSRKEEFNYEQYEKLAEHPKVVGIGECGLDYYRLPEGEDPGSIKDGQKKAFSEQMRLAAALDKALVIHCRPSNGTNDAYVDILEMLNDALPARFEVHSYTGDLATAKKFVELGAYLGLNGIITFDKTGKLEEVVKNIPLESIVLETDAPYLAPVPMRGKRNEPIYIEHVARKIAEWKNISFDEVTEATTKNAKKLFNI